MSTEKKWIFMAGGKDGATLEIWGRNARWLFSFVDRVVWCYIVFMFAFSSLGVNAMDIWNDTSLSDHPWCVQLLTIWLFPFPVVLLASATGLLADNIFFLLTDSDCTPPCTFFSQLSSWTWPWWVHSGAQDGSQLYLREVNSFLRVAVPLRSSKWSVLSWQSWPMTCTWLWVTPCDRYPVLMKWKTCYLMAWHPGWVE